MFWLLLLGAAWVAWKLVTAKPAGPRKQKPPARPASFPVMTMEMISSDGKPVDAATAVKLYKQFMLQTGYLDKQELAEHAEYFAQEVKDHGQSLADDVAHEKQARDEAVTGLKAEIAELKKRRAAASSEPERTELADELTDLEAEIAAGAIDLDEAREAAKAFRTDKRQFLIDHINQEIHGSPPSGYH